MKREQYKTPASQAEAQLTFKNSRFIGTAGYAVNVADAQHFISAVRQRYPDANHHAWAFKVDTLAGTASSSDDGEPGGTAGRPMLAVLEGSGLLNVVMVGTRYYGGIKLGPGGLVRAYSDTCRQALARLSLREYRLHQLVDIVADYALSQQVQYVARLHGCRVVDMEYGEHVRASLAVPVNSAAAFEAALLEVSNGQIQLAKLWLGEEYLAEG